MTCPSFFAASISAGVIGSGGGASAMTRVENAAPASNAPDPLSTSRRDIVGCFMGSSIRLFGDTGTPEVIFYSCHVHLVYRRQLIVVAARLGQTSALQNKNRSREFKMTGSRFALA